MVAFFIRIFAKNCALEAPNATRKRIGAICSFTGILLNILLFIGKFIIGFFANSISIQSDAVNNLSDAGSSVITLLGFKLSAKKPDSDHPFGHGRLEYLSGLFVSLLIILMGIELGKESVRKIIAPEPFDTSLFAITVAILSVSVLVKVYMFFYNRKYGKKIHSSAMLATSADSLSDSIATVVVLVSTIVIRFTGFNRLDGISGLLVSVFVLYAGYGAAKDTLIPLLGKHPEKEFTESIQKIVMKHEEIIGIHDLIVHDYGPGRMMISLHAEVSKDDNLLEIHDVIDNAENELKHTLQCDAVIHMDPVDTKNPVTLALKESLQEIIQSIDPQISMHDFRVVHGATHTNLIFDVVLPAERKMSEKDVCRAIREAVAEKHPNHFCVIQVDQNFAGKQ